MIANLDANTSVAKSISFRSGNSSRINLEVSGTESGSNAGADLFIRRYSDLGALIDTPLTITRSTGISTFLNNVGIGIAPTITAGITELAIGSSSTNPRISGIRDGVNAFSIYSASTGTDILERRNLDLRLGANNTTNLTLASTGASTFQGSLTINGTFVQNPSSGSGGFYIDRGTSTQSPYISWFNGSGTRLGYMGFSNTHIGLYLENSAGFVINGGNVGIGISPNIWNTIFRGIDFINKGGVHSYTNYLALTQNLYYGTGAFDAWRYKDSGYGAAISLESDSGSFVFRNTSSSGTTNSAATLIDRLRIQQLTAGGYVKAANDGSTYVSITSPYHEFNNNANSNCTIFNATHASLNTDGIVRIDSVRNTTNNSYYVLTYYNGGSGTYRFRVADSGNVTNTNNSYTGISDIKLKENITETSPKLNNLLKIRVVNYNLIGDNLKQIGVIAQELEQIFPSMIEEHEDFKEVEVTDEEGNVTKERQSLGTYTKAVKYSVFVPMIIKAMQEQQQQIEELKALINK